MDIATLTTHLESTRSHREALYRTFHRTPELSLQEHRTAELIAQELERIGADEITRVGDTGLVAVLRSGEGPVVALRADIDALPMAEQSDKEYSAAGVTVIDERTGEETPVAHSCGHDVHIVALLGALEALASCRDAWQGTVVGVFQPAEEIAAGARDMVEHGIAEAIPTPEVYLGQHVLGTIPVGHVGTRPGPALSQACSMRITLHGRGSHGAMPDLSVDPIVLGAAIITRLQSVVAREIAPHETAVLTVGSFHAGTTSSIIPETAELQLNTRAYSAEVADALTSAIERIVRAECAAARCPREPEIDIFDEYPLTTNDEEATARVRAAFEEHFGSDTVTMDPVPASEDFSVVPDALGVPYTYWGLGGFAEQPAPGNHSPQFAPDLQPTLDRGAAALLVAANAWLGEEQR